MAKVIKENSTLQEQSRSEVRILLIYWILAFLTFLIPVFWSTKNPFLYLIPFLALSYVGQSSWKHFILIRGNIGERRVFKSLQQLPDSYNILNDVVIRVADREAQIDHLLISRYGLWSIETKSHFGRIYGKEKDRNWTQKKKSDKGKIHTTTFYNPVSQNAVHCKRIHDYLIEKLGIEVLVKSVIVFTSADQLNVQVVTPVVTPRQLCEVILKSDTQVLFDDLTVNKIIDLMLNS